MANHPMSSPLPPYEQKPERMFLGEYERGLDSKGRITLPVAFREALGGDGAIITRGMDRCLFLFPHDFFETWRQKIKALPLADRHSRNLRRHIFSGASDIAPDGQGRINLPSGLREYANLDGSVIVAGNDTYVEVWDAQRWAEMRLEFENSATDAEAWAQLGI